MLPHDGLPVAGDAACDNFHCMPGNRVSPSANTVNWSNERRAGNNEIWKVCICRATLSLEFYMFVEIVPSICLEKPVGLWRVNLWR